MPWNRYWIKLWVETRKDPKYQDLRLDQQAVWVNLLMATAETSEPGTLLRPSGQPMDLSQIQREALATEMTPDLFQTTIALFEAMGMIHWQGGCLVITHWHDRQAPKDATAAERQRRHRASLRTGNGHDRDVTQGVTGAVTPDVTEVTPPVTGDVTQVSREASRDPQGDVTPEVTPPVTDVTPPVTGASGAVSDPRDLRRDVTPPVTPDVTPPVTDVTEQDPDQKKRRKTDEQMDRTPSGSRPRGGAGGVEQPGKEEEGDGAGYSVEEQF